MQKKAGTALEIKGDENNFYPNRYYFIPTAREAIPNGSIKMKRIYTLSGCSNYFVSRFLYTIPPFITN